jgi:hypothetical protein
LTAADVKLNRKSLSELAIHSSHVFDELVEIARSHCGDPAKCDDGVKIGASASAGAHA